MVGPYRCSFLIAATLAGKYEVGASPKVEKEVLEILRERISDKIDILEVEG